MLIIHYFCLYASDLFKNVKSLAYQDESAMILSQLMK